MSNMKFNFKVQQYQTDAVEAVIKVFNGQGYHKSLEYIRDVGEISGNDKAAAEQMNIFADEDLYDNTGFKNDKVDISDERLLENIQKLQRENNIKVSPKLIRDMGRCSLDVEMETGTGKTYVYIKTIFELNKRYGWTKFIVVVPSIAIREGVKKTFEITADHFMEHYGRRARFFVYSSANLTQLDSFSSDGNINVMIINTQAFASSLKEDGRSKESRIIYSRRDEFRSRRPIDVIRANRPIIILDEPQKMGGAVTQKALKNFDPLFVLNYSATHKTEHNLIYVLDALEAYNKRLVKKIEVKGFEVKNLRGTDSYLYLEEIIICPNKPPEARLELEIQYKSGNIKRETRKIHVNDDLYYISNEMEQYRGYTVAVIDPVDRQLIFTNGEAIGISEITGDVSEKDMRRIQIRETILSHFEKEEKLFDMGIKNLSLFFIDEVAKYRSYDENGEEIYGEYREIFEEEYRNILQDFLTLEDTPYQKYLREKCSEETAVHRGYFSIDKKTGHSVDSQLKRGSDFSDDISAYDLILKNKERLLSFDEPTRFIFSHSALREGWDNPNVFQICTLKHSDSGTAKRQEVGRGLRLCVDQSGNRIDKETAGESVHDINMLTIIASESYRDFAEGLQSDIKSELYDRPTKATVEYFEGKTVTVNGEPVVIDKTQAKIIQRYLIKNDYIDDNDNITEKYKSDLAADILVPVPEDIKDIEADVHKLIQAIFDDSILKEMISDGHETKIMENPLNDNFCKAEFQRLWGYINRKYAYSVRFDSSELIQKAVEHINQKLNVSELQYTTTTGHQKEDMNRYELERNASFDGERTRTQVLKHARTSKVKYDLVGKIATGAMLTRRTTAAILKGLRLDKLYMFKINPEEFITKVTRLINEQRATMVVDHITYTESLEKPYESSVFTAGKGSESYNKAYRATKAIQDYVFTDGTAAESVERKFVGRLEKAEEVCVYAKLPKGFHIPTPVGNYSPDWAIAFYEGTVKHIFFIAETKGTMESLELRPIEQAKISCAKKLFNSISTDDLMYDVVNNYDELLNIVMK